MIDQDTTNEVRSENLLITFDEALTDGDWDACRETLTLLEDMRIDTRELRREMNLAMEEDFVFEDYEAVIPPETEAEKRAWGVRYSANTRGSEEAEMQNLSMIARQSNA